MTLFSGGLLSVLDIESREINKILSLLKNESLFSEEIFDNLVDRGIFNFKDDKTLKPFYEYLFKTKSYEKIYQAIFRKKLDECLYVEMEYLLSSLYEMGRLEDFHKKSKETNEHLLFNKYYAKYEEFRLSFSSKLSRESFFIAGQLLYFSEKEDVESIVLLIDEQKNLILSKESSLEFIELTFNILEQVKKDDIKLYKLKTFYRFVLTSLGRHNIINKDIVEYLLMANCSEDYATIIEGAKNEKQQRLIFDYMSKTFKLEMNSILPFFKSTKEILKQKITKKISFKKEKSTSLDVEPFTSESENRLFPTLETANVLNDYQVISEERELLVYFQYENVESITSSDMVISFIKLGFYSIAKVFAEKLQESSNKYYLLSTIYFEMGRYSNCIQYANDCLNHYKISIQDSLPFEYLKGRAFEGLGDKKSARRCFQRIVSVDPTFRRTREKFST